MQVHNACFGHGPGYLLKLKATVRTHTVHANLGTLGPGSPGPRVH